ncbi:MAG: tripartite tricarboxylate transporter substrate binding protein [Hydrogenophaga sp.]|nr:tripartite tricarboxylate transporter substrate binding protein [Hydrogenophaga sp.]
MNKPFPTDEHTPGLSRRQLLAGAGAAGLWAGLPGAAWANEAANYPDRPVSIVVPYPAGGTTDILGRMIAEGIYRELGQQAVVINRPGAGAMIGANQVAKAPGDGYTLLLAAPGTWINSVIFKQAQFEFTDFQPVVLVGRSPLVVSVNPKLPVKTIQEFIAYGRANPGKLTYGNGGPGTSTTLTLEYFLKTTGIQAVGIAYGGSGQALTDLVAGNIDFFFDGISTSLPHFQSGRLRGLAITHGERLSTAPDIPTLKEAGYPQLVVDTLYGVLAPAKVPAPIVAKLHAVVNKVMNTEAAGKRLLELGVITAQTTTAGFKEEIDADLARWRSVVKPT